MMTGAMRHFRFLPILLLAGCNSGPPTAARPDAAAATKKSDAVAGLPSAPAKASGSTAVTGDASLEQLARALPNGAHPESGVVTAGQPDETLLPQLKATGIGKVINLREASEMTFDERAAVEAQGLSYLSIPMKGAAGLTRANAVALDQALLSGGPVLVHCGSSNRVGALFGLRAGLLEGKTADEAVAVARSHGMSPALEQPLRTALTNQ